MTIVISCLTHEYVIQVSDRRVTTFINNKITNADDNRNKAVNFCHRIAFGYAGLAEIKKEVRTDIWLTETLRVYGQQGIVAAAEAIRIQASNCLRQLPGLNSSNKRHAFVGVGWGIPAGEEEFCPIFLLISNFHDTSSNQLSQANNEFLVLHKYLNKSDRGALHVTGYELDSDLRIQLRRNLRKFTKKQLSPRLSVNFIADTIRRMSLRYPDYIGENLMALCIPRRSLKTDSALYLMGLPSYDSDTFLYLPSDSTSEIAYFPNFVCGDSSVTGGKTMWGQAAQNEANKMLPPTPPTALVLTDWVGEGTTLEPRHAAVADSFVLDSISDFTGADSWPSNSKCPYYGLLVAINASDEVIDSISQNKNHLVITYQTYQSSSKASIDWISSLINWLAARGMPIAQRELLYEKLTDMNWHSVVEELIQLLRTPKSS